MKKYFTNWFRKSAYLFVLTGFISAHAGSYEDFFTAIKQDNAGVVQQLLARGFDPNTIDPKGQHGLYLALQEPSLKVAQVLMDWPKTDVNKLNAQGESPLMIAALKGELDMADKLIKKDADVNKTGWTPLHYAASKGQLAIMSLLLDNDAYIDAESPNGTTPLMMAAMYGTAPAVKLLLDAGADPLLKNQQNLTAIEFAYRASRTESAQLIAAAIRSKNATGKW
ncbi:ankyrin repeat domain-containing protein [Polaromonas sp. UC242_47]|uniref:ankyrin repeat domain-containing protein n=1 Tax=Polaromonas sp. UC242_47 TaxID=3374626 RepID=UPI0037B5C20E